MHIITEDESSYHARALYRRLSVRPYRILYVGLDLQLMKCLEDNLNECWIVRAPTGLVARLFIDKLNYSLLLFDEVLPDTTGGELTRFVRSLAHREHTPIIIFRQSGGFELMVRRIAHQLICPKSA